MTTNDTKPTKTKTKETKNDYGVTAGTTRFQFETIAGQLEKLFPPNVAVVGLRMNAGDVLVDTMQNVNEKRP